MEALLCLACAAMAGCSAWIAFPGSDASGILVRLQMIGRLLRRGLRRLSTSRIASLLLESEAFDEAVATFARRVAVLADWPRREVAALVVCLACGIVVVGALVARSMTGALVLLLLLVGGARLQVAASRRRRSVEVAREMPSVFRTLAAAIESGNTLVQAIDYVGLRERGPAAEAFAHASLGLRCGLSVDEVLERFNGELDAPGVGLMSTALSISQRTGSPLRDLFRRSAILVEHEQELERTLAVRTAQVRLSVRVVCGLPVLMVAVLSLISPDFQEGILTGVGSTCLLMAMALDALALLIIHRIMEGVLR